jgi:transcriptional antiterminator NusG
MENVWYLLKVIPGKERSLTQEFNRFISLDKIKNVIRFVCPTEKDIRVVRNKKVTREKVIYGGYIYFECNEKLNDDDLKIIANLPNVMSMMGDKKPIILRDNDIKRVLKDDILDTYRFNKLITYNIGETVMVIDGPFKSFEGKISELHGDRILLEVKIFGRNTNVELNSHQIEKI